MAGKIALDLKKFKHVKSDKDTTTLRHADGHELTMFHKSLSPDFQKQLSALAPMAKNAQTSQQAQESQDQQPKHYDEGGEATNELGFKDKMKVNTSDIKPTASGSGSGGAGSSSSSSTVRSPARAKQNDAMLGQGKSVQEIQADEAKNPMAKGGKVQNYAEAGEVSKDDATKEAKEPSLQERMAAIEQAVAPIMKDQVETVGGPQPDVQKPTMGQVGQDVGNFLMSQPGAPEAPSPYAQQQPQAQSEPQAQPQAQATQDQAPEQAQAQEQAPQNNDPFGNQAYLESAQKGIESQQKGIEQQFEASKQMGEQRAVADVSYQAQLQHMQDQFMKQNAMDNSNVQKTVADIQNNHINPRHYQENMTSGDKVRAAIGLIAGGMGAGLTHGPNLAAQYLNSQIDRDISAQQNNQGNRMTLLHAYQQQYQNHNSAMMMTKATLQSLYGSQLAQAADNAATPQARATMLKEAGDLQMKSADLVKQATMMRFMTQGMGGRGQEDPEAAFRQSQQFLMLTNPALAKSRAEAHIPGIGDAPAGTVIPNEVKQQIVAHKTVNDLMNMSLDFSKNHAGTLNPAERAQASSIQGQLIGAVKQAQHDGVYKPSEAEYLISQIGGSPASFLASFSSVPKIKELQQIKQHEFNNLLSTYGFPQQQLPKGGEGNQHEGKIAEDAKGNRVIMKNGRWIPLSGR